MGIEYVCERIQILLPKDPNKRKLSIGKKHDGQGWIMPGEVYIFRYLIGKEYELEGVLCDAIRDKRIHFDWYDASVITFKLGNV
jgi:hypothetical protein